ncbi:MAG: biotin--[Clostridia bacterium]|nr:biotin--[acetyl-CoA-carboxylase] ligase [Clostridia bacterium]
MIPKYTLYPYETLPSTNDMAHTLAQTGAPEWSVVVAHTQTAGRGRLNRKFHSPRGTGLYMSVLLRPQIAPCDALKITTAAAVSVAEAVERIFGVDVKIKWVNDVLVAGKKVCGILTESRLSGEALDYAVLGIGVNLATPSGDFPEEIREIAGAVSDGTGDLGKMRTQLMEGILEAFYPRYQNLNVKPCPFLEDYKARLCCLNRPVHILGEDGTLEKGTPVDLEPDFSLRIVMEDGQVKCLRAGEISLRLS